MCISELARFMIVLIILSSEYLTQCNVRCREISRHHVTGNITPAIANVQKVGSAKSVGQRTSGSER
jgi:hypothetical protein